MDITAILDQSGALLFPTATILKASISPSSTYAQHVIEDGTVVSDNKITNQLRISVSAILNPSDYKDVYKKIGDASRNSDLLSVQSRTETFSNMYIESYPSEENAAIFDTVSITINLIEQITGSAIIKKLSALDVSDPADVDTENRGEQLPKNSRKTSLQSIAGFFQ